MNALAIRPDQTDAWTIARFMLNVKVSPRGCWEWQGVLNAAGYGRISLDGRYQLAHRISYRWFRGPIPDGLVIDHVVCDNRCCVNPEHIIATTSSENNRRSNGQARKTHCKHGHPLSGENLRIRRTDGARLCITCRRSIQRRWDTNNKKDSK